MAVGRCSPMADRSRRSQCYSTPRNWRLDQDQPAQRPSPDQCNPSALSTRAVECRSVGARPSLRWEATLSLVSGSWCVTVCLVPVWESQFGRRHSCRISYSIRFSVSGRSDLCLICEPCIAPCLTLLTWCLTASPHALRCRCICSPTVSTS